MRIWCQKLTDVAAAVKSDVALKMALSNLSNDIGFDYFAYLDVRSSNIMAISTYPNDWQQRYFAQGYADIDPIVRMARRESRLFVWETENNMGTPTKRAKTFLSEALGFGIRSGITIPVRTAFNNMAMLTLASHRRSTPNISNDDELAATSAVAQLHAGLRERPFTPTSRSRISLTPRQAVCLKWSAEGKSMKAIALIENMTYANVNFHLNRARAALNAGTLAQATYIAGKLDLI